MIDCAIHSIVSAAVDIGIVIFRQSSHSDVLLTPTVFSFHTSLYLVLSLFLLVIPTSFFIVKCFYYAYLLTNVHVYCVYVQYVYLYVHIKYFLCICMYICTVCKYVCIWTMFACYLHQINTNYDLCCYCPTRIPPVYWQRTVSSCTYVRMYISSIIVSTG